MDKWPDINSLEPIRKSHRLLKGTAFYYKSSQADRAIIICPGEYEQARKAVNQRAKVAALVEAAQAFNAKFKVSRLSSQEAKDLAAALEALDRED